MDDLRLWAQVHQFSELFRAALWRQSRVREVHRIDPEDEWPPRSEVTKRQNRSLDDVSQLGQFPCILPQTSVSGSPRLTVSMELSQPCSSWEAAGGREWVIFLFSPLMAVSYHPPL